jgi:hypothetical protein
VTDICRGYELMSEVLIHLTDIYNKSQRKVYYFEAEREKLEKEVTAERDNVCVVGLGLDHLRGRPSQG